MLSIQSSINQTSFGQLRRRGLSPEEVRFREEQAELAAEREDILRQRYELEALANDNEAPNIMKKIAKVGAFLTAGAAVGLTAGAGTKILINKFKAFKSSEFLKGVKKYYNSFKSFVNDSVDTIKKNFKRTDIYKKPAGYANKKFEQFAKSGFGKSVVNFTVKAKNITKQGFNKLKAGFNIVVNKVKSINSEKIENAVVGTVGVSSGVCASVNSLKENSEAGDK